MDTDSAKQERERLDQLPCPERDHRETTSTGVLLSDEIEYYVNAVDLIRPFNPDNLKSAGYELTIGDEYVLGGERKQLGKDGEIRIPPFNVAVIKTSETINLPRFLIARWNIRVRWAYEGLLWVGGPQVDPGWVGHLFCPLYNLSDKTVVLRFGDAIALMDFVTTTPFNPQKSKKYARPPKRVLLQEYRAVELSSALYTLAETKLKGYEAQVTGIQGRVDTFILITFTVIAVLFAAVTIFVARTEQPTWWNPVLFLISGTALFMSGAVWVRTSKDENRFGRIVQVTIVAFIVAATALQLWLANPLQTQIDGLKKEIEQLQQQSKPPQVTSPAALPAGPPPPASATGKQSQEKEGLEKQGPEKKAQ